MTSSDCLPTNNLHPRLPTKSRVNLPASSIHNIKTDELRPSLSNPILSSSSPTPYFTPIGNIPIRYPQPNMFAFPRPPSTSLLPRRSSEFNKPPEQDLLDKNFFQTFNMEQKEEEKVNDNKINISTYYTSKSFIHKNSFFFIL